MTKSASDQSTGEPELPPFAERGFRWIRETVSLIYAHHQHPLPMVAMIFMYAETLGKPLVGHKASTEEKVAAFAEAFLPKLWDAFSWTPNRKNILANHYRNGLAHQMFMKNDAGIHEDRSGDTAYVSQAFPGIPYSINIDRLVPEFLDGLSQYYDRLQTNSTFRSQFIDALPKGKKDD